MVGDAAYGLQPQEHDDRVVARTVGRRRGVVPPARGASCRRWPRTVVPEVLLASWVHPLGAVHDGDRDGARCRTFGEDEALPRHRVGDGGRGDGGHVAGVVSISASTGVVVFTPR